MAIICALIVNADVLILDEPTGGLDAFSRKQLMTYLLQLVNPPKIILCITHEVDWLEYPEFEVLCLDDGRLVNGCI